MAFYSYLSTKIIIEFITKSYQDLFGVRSYINAIGNPFKDCVKVEFNACVNYSSCYTDIMLCKQGKKDVSDLAA